jgi:hypothetical protein
MHRGEGGREPSSVACLGREGGCLLPMLERGMGTGEWYFCLLPIAERKLVCGTGDQALWRCRCQASAQASSQQLADPACVSSLYSKICLHEFQGFSHMRPQPQTANNTTTPNLLHYSPRLPGISLQPDWWIDLATNMMNWWKSWSRAYPLNQRSQIPPATSLLELLLH